jgi:hypothetical protein
MPQVALIIAKSSSIQCPLILKQTIDYLMENGELARSPEWERQWYGVSFRVC